MPADIKILLKKKKPGQVWGQGCGAKEEEWAEAERQTPGRYS